MPQAHAQGVNPARFNPIYEFNSLPDIALVDIKTVVALKSRSKSSIYRDISAGRLPRPTIVGSSSRWRVEDVRAYLAGKNE